MEEKKAPVVARFGVTRLYRDAGAMSVSAAASALLGAGFWAMAAKLFPPTELGVMTAIMSAITATGVVVASGVGDAYTALLPAVGAAREQLYYAGQRVFWVIAIIGAIGAAVGTIGFIDEVRASAAVAILVILGVLVWSAVNVQSSVVAALGKARWLPAANTAVGIAKIILLPLVALTLHWHSIELSFVIATAGMVIGLRSAIASLMKKHDELPPASLEESAATRMFGGFLAQSVASSGLNFGIVMLSPFLVTAFAGAEQGAAFALSLSVVQVLDLVTMSMSISLVVHASSAPGQAWAMTRGVLTRSLAFTAVGAIVVAGLAPVVLTWLDPRYGALGIAGVVGMLAAVCVVRAVYTVWSGLQRARRNITMPLVFNALFAAALPLLMMVFCSRFGALGGALSLMIGQLALSVAAGTHMAAYAHREAVPTELATAC